jgi:hypothetical protein
MEKTYHATKGVSLQNRLYPHPDRQSEIDTKNTI